MPKRPAHLAKHPEETTGWSFLDGNKVEEFDFEGASSGRLKEHLLAKVTRVELRSRLRS